MNLKSTLFSALFFLCIGTLSAQDIHNTLFNYNPLNMNPAMSGAYSGTVRIGGIYRDQGRSALSSNAFTTPAFFADAPVFMVGKRHWVGVGLMAYQDNVGTLGQKTSTIQLSGAFHYSLNRKSTSVLTFGVQGGQLTRSYSAAEFLGTDNISLNQSMVGPENGNETFDQDADASGLDLNAGVMLKSKLNKTTNLTAGLSARHLTTPDLSVAGGSEDDRDFKFRFIGHAELEMDLNEKFSIAPTLYFTNMASASQLQLQGWGGYMLNKEKNIKLKFGLGYRIGDAGEILVGLDYGDLRVALGYDLTLSGLSDANNGNGGFEIAANYIIKVYKKPQVTPAVLCPQL
jgi:type IX secretion system PorP/SprF family membrane protein